MKRAPGPGANVGPHAPRLLVVTPDYPPERGGIQTLIERLATGFEAFQTRVLTLAPGDRRPPDRDPIPVRRIRAGSDQRVRLAALNSAALGSLVVSPPDVVLSAHCWCVPATEVAQRLRGVPVLQYFHANEITARPALARRAAAAADVSVCVSRYTERLLADAGASARRVELIPPGVDPAPGERPARDPAAPPTLVTVARLRDRYKGHDTVLRAMPSVLSRVPSARWVVIGDGPLRGELEALADREGVAAHVDFLGAVDDGERDRRLAQADVFVMPSRLPGGRLAGEGFGIVLLEAAAAGLPVVAGAVGGALDAVEDGVSGLLVDPDDAAALGEALAGLLADPARARAMGEAGAARARSFAWPLIVSRVEAILLELAK